MRRALFLTIIVDAQRLLALLVLTGMPGYWMDACSWARPLSNSAPCAQSSPSLLWITLCCSLSVPIKANNSLHQLPGSALTTAPPSCLSPSFGLHKNSLHTLSQHLSWHMSSSFIISLITCLSPPIYSSLCLQCPLWSFPDNLEKCILRLSKISRFLLIFSF